MLLVGGLADYLSLSALTSGLVAGLFWQRAGGPAAESLRRDLGYLQHPLVVLLLVTAGARTVSLGDASAAAESGDGRRECPQRSAQAPGSAADAADPARGDRRWRSGARRASARAMHITSRFA